jgi:non-heme chloroperoxidase
MTASPAQTQCRSRRSPRPAREDRAAFFAGFSKDSFGAEPRAPAVRDQLLEWASGTAMPAGLRATLECLKSFPPTEFRGGLAVFKVPTLVIQDAQDKAVPIDSSSRIAAGQIKQGTLIEYDSAPHGLFATHKRRLSKDLLDFLGR